MAETVRPVDATADGCPVLAKGRVVVADKGTNPTLVWELRDRDGNPLDVSAYLCDSQESEENSEQCGQVIFRFADAVLPGTIQQVIGRAVDGGVTGLLEVDLPDVITDQATIWQFQVAVTNSAGKIQHMNSGLLSIERGLFGDVDQLTGPPTLQELRLMIRDSAAENSRLQDFEFSDIEVVHAITRPIMQWNERPPQIGKVVPASFPYRENWAKAAVGELLQLAAHNYRRNKTQMSAAGVTDQSLDRDNPYEAKAQLLRQEWLAFVDHEKVRINANMAWGTHSSGWY